MHFADDKSNVAEKLKFVLGREENIVGQTEKMLVPSIFLLFPKCFQKSPSVGSLKV